MANSHVAANHSPPSPGSVLVTQRQGEHGHGERDERLAGRHAARRPPWRQPPSATFHHDSRSHRDEHHREGQAQQPVTSHFAENTGCQNPAAVSGAPQFAKTRMPTIDAK